MRPHSCPKFFLCGGTYKTPFIGDAENAGGKIAGVENKGVEISAR